jgi:hypothetical protein
VPQQRPGKFSRRMRPKSSFHLASLLGHRSPSNSRRSHLQFTFFVSLFAATRERQRNAPLSRGPSSFLVLIGLSPVGCALSLLSCLHSSSDTDGGRPSSPDAALCCLVCCWPISKVSYRLRLFRWWLTISPLVFLRLFPASCSRPAAAVNTRLL